MNFQTVIPPNAPPSFVLDVSVARAWAVPQQYTVYAHRVQSRLAFGSVALIATNWPLDLVDALLATVNSGATTRQRADVALANLSAYQIYLDPEGPFRSRPETLDLARAHNVSAREAAHLELALRMSLPLATIDPILSRAASAAGVPIFTP
jgi:predicted nucleic acid-binding protein